MPQDNPTITVEQEDLSIRYTLNIPIKHLNNPNMLTLNMQQRMARASEENDVPEALMILAEILRNIRKEADNG